MRLQTSSLPVAVVTLSLLIDSSGALPVRHIAARDVDLVGQLRTRSVEQTARRPVVIKRGYYVGARKSAKEEALRKRDRFAPYGYPVSVARRDDSAASKGGSPAIPSDDIRTATSVEPSDDSASTETPAGNTTSNATSTTPQAASGNSTTTITLPKGITASSNGFLFIPATQQQSPASTTMGGKAPTTQPVPSVTRQTFYVNIEAGLGGSGQTYQIDTSNGGTSKSGNATSPGGSKQGGGLSATTSGNGTSSTNQQSSSSGGHPKPSAADKAGSNSSNSTVSSGQDDSYDDDAKKASQPAPVKSTTDDKHPLPSGDASSGSSSSQAGGSAVSNNATDVRRIIFKPLQDPDSGSSANATSSATVDVKGADQAETQDLKDVSNGDDKKASNGGSNAQSDDNSDGNTSNGSSIAAADSSASVTTSANSSTSTSTSSSSNTTSPKSKSGDNYFLFPVDKEKQQVDLSKGDMIAYVEHPASAAQSAASKQQRRHVGTSGIDAADYLRREQAGRDVVTESKRLSHDFSRRAKDFFKRNLVKGKPGAKIEYWKGQKLHQPTRSLHDDLSALEIRDFGTGLHSVQVLRRASADDYIANDRPVFYLVKRDPEESLAQGERLYSRSM